jgi:hypothetical protein
VGSIHKWPKNINRAPVVATRIFILHILMFFFQAMKLLLFISILISLSTVVVFAMNAPAAPTETDLKLEQDKLYTEFVSLLHVIYNAEINVLRALSSKITANKSFLDEITELEKNKDPAFFKLRLYGAIVIINDGLSKLDPPMSPVYVDSGYFPVLIVKTKDVTKNDIEDITAVIRQLNGLFPSSSFLSKRDLFSGIIGVVVGVLGMTAYIFASDKDVTEATHPDTKTSMKPPKKMTHASKPGQKSKNPSKQ